MLLYMTSFSTFYAMEYKKSPAKTTISLDTISKKEALEQISPIDHFENLTNEFEYGNSSIVFSANSNPRYRVSVIGHKPLYADDLALHQPTARFAVEDVRTDDNSLLIGDMKTGKITRTKTGVPIVI